MEACPTEQVLASGITENGKIDSHNFPLDRSDVCHFLNEFLEGFVGGIGIHLCHDRPDTFARDGSDMRGVVDTAGRNRKEHRVGLT